jgi:hypothetical protein
MVELSQTDGCTYGEVDMKWASEEHLYDANYGELI